MANKKVPQDKKTNQHMDKYSLVMVPKDVHAILKEYCDYHGYKLSGFVSSLIRKNCK